MKFQSFSILLWLFCSLLISCGQPANTARPAAAIIETPAADVTYAAPAAETTLEYDKNNSSELSEEVSDASEDAAQDEHIAEDNTPVKAVHTEKKIIKNGTMSVKVETIEESKKRIDAALKKCNGYYETERLSNESDRVEYTLKLRVPSSNFDALIHEIEQGKDEIISKQMNAEDVTEEFVDLEARLQNKREYLERYRSILRNAKNVKEMMQVEENIRNLQEEIESKEGRLRFLKDQVNYSTLDLTLFHNKEYVFREEEENSFTERFKAALSGGWNSIIDFCIGLTHLWPILLVVLVVAWIIRRYTRKRMQRKGAQQSTETVKTE